MKGLDEIRIDGLEVFANHGVFPEETRLGQKFLVSMRLYLSTRRAGLGDELAASVHYGEVCEFVTAYLKEHTWKLIEAAAEQTARAVLLRWPLIEGLSFELKKPWAPVGLPLESVSVRIERRWRRAYVALGSNLGDRRAYLEGAVEALRALPDCRVGEVSDFIETKPFGGVEQGDFLNGCLWTRCSIPWSCCTSCKKSSRRRTGSASFTGGPGPWIWTCCFTRTRSWTPRSSSSPTPASPSAPLCWSPSPK